MEGFSGRSSQPTECCFVQPHADPPFGLRCAIPSPFTVGCCFGQNFSHSWANPYLFHEAHDRCFPDDPSQLFLPAQCLTSACPPASHSSLSPQSPGDSPLAGSSLLAFSASGAGRDIIQHCVCPEMSVIQNTKHLRLCQFRTFRAGFMLREQ